MMEILTRRLNRSPHTLALLAALVLASCNSVTPGSPDATLQPQTISSANPSAFKYLHDLVGVPARTSTADLEKLYSGIVITRDVTAGTATIANNALNKGRYDSAPAVEVNERKFSVDVGAQGYNAWSSGYNAWSSGYNAWSSGYNAWSSGTTSTATTFIENIPTWDFAGIGGAQALVPELGKGIKVAVIDTGIDMNHPAFTGKIDTTYAKDYLDGDKVPQDVNLNTDGTFSAAYGHGTAVAGIITQIAPNATILPIRVLDATGGGDTATIASAIDYAVASGAKVINLSLGSTSDSAAVNQSIKNAVSKLVTVFIASGNSGTTNVLYPAARSLDSAALGNGSIGIGSVNLLTHKSSFSTYGANLEFTAPGENIVTAFPGNGIVAATGTSFATPIVSATAALVLSAGVPIRTTDDTKVFMNNMAATATPSTDPTYGTQLGRGTLNAFKFADIYR
ncbi:putative Peptidase S8 and S53, subtilisin, kexin, sedolisin precursor [Deinococcus deserti VCD115]|uniref:Putative Peptidase S8 and S53, subtilisin, kexin, sedolisin n=2 Tax=Deinococcus TaxID=1298 RepID=C1CYG4_DEIDV|nr:S8 family serine peptidase [Deinococcus deserti]ACO44985.1 putative Peptidase S8 and S53, subtilisin, kexin, sedolisin precursor [Deinococcus deserti VCD115]